MGNAEDNTSSSIYYDVIRTDALALEDLSITRALTFIPEPAKHNFRIMYQWFIDNSGTIGPRLHGERLPGVDPDFPHTAMRGIHVPAMLPKDRKYAATITSTGVKKYSKDKPLISLDDGTWLLVYSAHTDESGSGEDSLWNDALLNNLRDGVPVGVFLKMGSKGYFRSLAYVEDFNPVANVFVLHGPVRADNDTTFASPLAKLVKQAKGQNANVSVEELERDRREFKTIQQAMRQGQTSFRKGLLAAYDGKCAMTDCSVEEALQAAHIINYHGMQSNGISNGMLLRADVHLLFDRNLLAVNPDDSKIVVSKHLRESEYAELSGRRIRRPAESMYWPNASCLLAKYQLFEQSERAS